LRYDADMFRNIVINLRAKGPAAILITWLLCFTALALFGTGSLAACALGFLSVFGFILLSALAHKVD